MEREYADVLMRHINAIELLLGGMTYALDKCPETEVVQGIRGAVFRTVDHLHEGVTVRLAKLYPDLNPQP